MSTYLIYYSDNTKSLEIVNGDLNKDQTSLTFIGKNASNYAEALSTNFLHLLENFAYSKPPTNPIEGQLWFDNSDPTNKKLRINDGTSAGANWKPINGLYQQDTTPDQASKGDVWVDTGKAQLFLTLDGVNWTLVGPTYSSTLKTGSYPEQITDTFGNVHSIIKNYIDDAVVEIISPDSFTPQLKIEGFTTIKSGLNLTSVNSALLNATAYATQNIYVTSPTVGYVSGNNFVRNDISNSINGTLNLKGGLTVGVEPTFRLEKIGVGKKVNTFINSSENGNFAFQVLKDEVYNEILTVDGDTQRVGINKPIPTAALDVNGDVLISGSLTITNALVITGTAIFDKTVTLSNTATFSSTSTFRKGIILGSSTDTTDTAVVTMIDPAVDTTYNIGSNSKKFRTVYANTFNGDLTGTASTASSLTLASSWEMTGDIASSVLNYKGQGGTYRFTTTVQQSVIESKPSVTFVENDDEILVSVSTATFESVPASGGTGVGATFTVDRGPSSYSRVNVFNSGTDYTDDDSLTIFGSYLGGVDGINDIVIDLAASGAVNSLGSINAGSFTYVGTPISGLAKATKRALIGSVEDYLVPPGAMIPYGGINPPPGWLFCDGSVVDKTDYPRLFTAIGYLYGATDIITKFRLPDLKGRMVIGYDDMTNAFETSTGGAGRVPSATTPNLGLTPAAGAAAGVAGGDDRPNPISTVTNFGSTITGVTTEVMNPYLAMSYIIKV